MGRTVRFDQVYVTSLDADPIEQEVLTSASAIITGEIEADEVVVSRIGISNSNPTKSFSVGADLFMNAGQEIVLDVNKSIRTERVVVNDKMGIGTLNPTRTFEIQKAGADKVVVDTNDGTENLFIITGNTLSTNLKTSSTFRVGENLVADSSDSNVLHIGGNTFSTNVTVGTQLVVGTEVDPNSDSNVAVFKNGNVVVQDGILRVFGDVEFFGNLAITEAPDYTSVNNLVVSNAVIQMGTGNNGTYDTALLMVDQPNEANLFVGYTHSDKNFNLSRTFGGPETQTFTFDTSNTLNLYVHGELYTQNNFGIANTSPDFSLSVGSNLYINDTAGASNLLHANGYGYFEGLRIGDNGLTVGNLITLDADADVPMLVNSNIQAHGIQTTGSLPSGIANTAPTDSLSIGDKLFVNVHASSANTMTVEGNLVTGRLITQSIQVTDLSFMEGATGITASENIIIHADFDGEDTNSNVASIRAGPLGSNISSIDISGAKLTPEHQRISFKTKNTERVRIAADGKMGIANTAPSEALTIGGNLKINGSNAAIYGNVQTYMKSYADPTLKQTKVESVVGSGKGLNFYASTTSTMGSPKLTILESSNVGVGTATPQGLLHTSGGTVLVNGPNQYTNSFNNAGTPLIVSNTTSISNSTLDVANVMHLTREGTSVRDGVRATLKMGKYSLDSGKSRSKLDIFLSDDRYTDETEVLTLRADGRVGIGHTQPTAHLEVKCTGISNPETNGLLVHNHNNGDAIMAAQADSLEGNAFTSFILSDGQNRSGWSMGVANNNDFRIAQNHEKVTDSTATALYISDSDRNVGLGTDVPRAKLEVNGNVVIGNELYFGGLLTDEYGNTFIKERLLTTDVSELLIFKGNEGPGGQGPDQIRYVASQHVFQSYNDPSLSAVEKEDIENQTGASKANSVLTITPGGQVLIGTTNSGDIVNTATTKLFVNGGFEFASGQKLNLGTLDVFSLSSGGILETIGSTSDLIFRNKVGSNIPTEYARFLSTGLIGFGTDNPSTNVHIYSGVTADIDVLKLESPGTNTKTGILLNTNANYGGYLRGFSSGSIHGTVLGGVNNGAESDGLHVIHTSNVGVGTSAPTEKFHVYDGTARVEHSSSNAVIQLKTTAGTSNIHGDISGNVYITPQSGELFLESSVEVSGDLVIKGIIDLGEQVAIGLGGSLAQTDLHVGGGMITNSGQVACKRYSNVIVQSAPSGNNTKTLTFGNGAFYAKIVASLREYDEDKDNMSTLILEINGGTSDETTPGTDITIGTKNIFGNVGTAYPWSSSVTTTGNSITIQPLFLTNLGTPRKYKFDIFVELISSTSGKLVSIKSGTLTHATFTY
jgi:hypothetical protein